MFYLLYMKSEIAVEDLSVVAIAIMTVCWFSDYYQMAQEKCSQFDEKTI